MNPELLDSEINRPQTTAMVPYLHNTLPPPDESIKVEAQSFTENRPMAPPSLAAPAARSTFEFGPDNAPHPTEFAAAEAAPASLASTAAGIGLGVAGAQVAVGAATALAEGAKSPKGSIGAFLPAGDGGGGTDYAGAAISRAVLAALNSAAKIPTRLGG